jgi:hypothetical protein
VKANKKFKISDFIEFVKNPKKLAESYTYDFVQEAVITSYPIKKLLYKLYNGVALHNSQVSYEDSILIHDLSDDNLSRKLVQLKFRKDNEWLILSLIEDAMTYGYFVSDIRTDGRFEIPFDEKKLKEIIFKIKNECVITLEPLYTTVVKCPSILYHISPSSNDKKILKEGLLPKSKVQESFHPYRIYVSINKEDINGIIEDFSRNDKVKKMNIIKKLISKNLEIKDFKPGEMTIFEINTKGLNLKLMEDPKCVDDEVFGYFIYDRIPPEYIKIIQKIQI